MKSEWIKVSGERIEVSPENGKDYSLEELQRFVGGFIEIVYLGNLIMVVNEEGAINGMEHNEIASLIVMMAGGQDPIFGDVLVCPKEMVK